MLHYRTRRRLFSALVLIVAYVTLLSPIAFVMIASFDYGQRAYVVFPPDRFTLDSYWRIPMRYWDSLWISVRVAFLCMLISCAIGIPAATLSAPTCLARRRCWQFSGLPCRSRRWSRAWPSCISIT